MKSFKQFQESVTQEVGGKGLTSALIRGFVNVSKSPLNKATKVTNIFLSKKKEDLLGAVRKKQSEIETEVANKETIDSSEVKKHIKKEKGRGKYVIKKPENEFHREGAVLAVPSIANNVISTGAALWGLYNTIKNNQGPGIKPGSGTKKGGVWDKLPKGQSSNWSKGNNLTGIAKEVEKKRNKDILKKYIKDKYGNKDQLTGGTLPEEMIGKGAIV